MNFPRADERYSQGESRFSAGSMQGSFAPPPLNLPTEEEPLLRSFEKARPTLTVAPEESVYSAMLFLPAISRLKTGTEHNRSARLALMLVVLNALLQIGVVQVINIYDHNDHAGRTRALIPLSEIVSQGKHTSTSEEAVASSSEASERFHRSFLPPHEKAELDATKDITPLCERIGEGNGTMRCTPHSVMFVHEWSNLDSNRDGVWTREEAEKDAAHLKAKLGVSPITVFNNVINGLHMTASYWDDYGGDNRTYGSTFYLSTMVKKGHGIPKAYFNYWKGDAMVCSLFDPNSCEAAASDGIFKEALHPGRVSAGSKGIHDLDSAIQYCYRMLQPGGGCETLLPIDFKRNRFQRWGRCGQRSLVEGGKYVNPYRDDESVHILRTSYASVSAYERATSRLFLFFLSLVITLWLLSLIDELRELIKFAEFLFVFPRLSPGDKGGSVIPANEETGQDTVYVITALSGMHRVVLIVVFFLRVLVFSILSQFGTRFLLVETDFLNLVMNSLALTFILTIDAMLYELVESSVTKELMCAKELEFQTSLPTEGCKGYMLKKECWGLFLVPLLSILIVGIYTFRNKAPVLMALECACLQEGEKCLDSIQYQAGWWFNYWTHDLPGSMHQIEALRLAAK
jgi:hypothetical protein